MTPRRRFPWIGVTLIAVGAVLLLEKFSLLSFETSTLVWIILMLFGVVKVGQGFSRPGGGVFVGTVAFLYGLYFLLHTFDDVELRPHLFLPASFLIFGFAFLMLFFRNIREWIYILPALLLLSAGSLFLLNRLGYFDAWDVGEVLRVYWPLGLILIGVMIVLKRRSAGRPLTPPSPPVDSAAGNVGGSIG